MRTWRLVVIVLVVLGTAFLFYRWWQVASSRAERQAAGRARSGPGAAARRLDGGSPPAEARRGGHRSGRRPLGPAHRPREGRPDARADPGALRGGRSAPPRVGRQRRTVRLRRAAVPDDAAQPAGRRRRGRSGPRLHPEAHPRGPLPAREGLLWRRAEAEPEGRGARSRSTSRSSATGRSAVSSTR